MDALQRYQKNAPYLTFLLYAFSVPILGLILAFIGLVTGLFVGQQRGEMAILRSRGASSWQVVGISMLQGILLAIVALAGGIFLGYWIAHSIGQARSFMDFTASGGLRVSLTASALIYGIAGIGVILLIQMLIPTLGGAGTTIVTYKQERARLLAFTLVAAILDRYSSAHSSRLWPVAIGKPEQPDVGGQCEHPKPIAKPFAPDCSCDRYFCSSLIHIAGGAAFDESAELGLTEVEKRWDVNGGPIPGQNASFL